MPTNGRTRFITLRAVVIGTGLAAFLAAINPFVDFLARDWHVGSGSLLQGPVVVLVGLVLLNSLLARLAPGLAFGRCEVIVIYAIGICSVGLVRQGGLPYAVSATVYPFYFASKENGWESLIWPHIPRWLAPGSGQAVEWFWEGLPAGYGVPWGAWIRPAIAWGSFMVALLAAGLSLGALFRKDWIERQRLTFPLVDVPMSIIGREPWPTARSSALGLRVFWIGFVLSSSLVFADWLHRVFPIVPVPAMWIHVGGYFTGAGVPWSVLSDMVFTINFAVIGISFLIPADVSLSLWLFYLLFKVQLAMWAAAGMTSGGAYSGLDPGRFISYQEAGAFLALAAGLVYESRATIRAALRGSQAGSCDPADPSRPFSDRRALVVFAVANCALLWWATSAGSSCWSFLILMGVFYAVMICSARLVAAAGVMYVGTSFFSRDVVVSTVGALPFGPRSLTVHSYLSVVLMTDTMNLILPQIMNSYKLLHTGRVNGRLFPLAAGVAVIVVMASGLSALLLMVYQHGANSLWPWPLTSFSQRAFGNLDASLRTPEMPDGFLRAALGAGAAVALLLSWLHTRFVWWPISPVGFLLASSWPMNWVMWSSVMVGWAANRMVNRYGGLQLFRRVRPAFVGLVLGDFLMKALLGITSYLLGIKGIGWA